MYKSLTPKLGKRGCKRSDSSIAKLPACSSEFCFGKSRISQTKLCHRAEWRWQEWLLNLWLEKTTWTACFQWAPKMGVLMLWSCSPCWWFTSYLVLLHRIQNKRNTLGTSTGQQTAFACLCRRLAFYSLAQDFPWAKDVNLSRPIPGINPANEQTDECN